MKEEYVFEVSKLRALEGRLLSTRQLYEMASAKDEGEVQGLLKSAGYEIFDDFQKTLAQRKKSLLSQLFETVEHCPELDTLLTKNDIQNIKTAVKCIAAARSAEGLFVYPTRLDTDTLLSSIRDGKFDEIDEKYSDTAKQGYDIISSSGDGQLFEAFADKAVLELMKEGARQCGSKMLDDYVTLFIKLCDAKTAFRCAKYGKSEEFALSAICGTDELPDNLLCKAAARGLDEVVSLLENSDLKDGAELLSTDPAAFEKWGNDRLMDIAKGAKLEAFGPDPVIAYYIACEAEVKAVATVMFCKRTGESEQRTKERLGELYV